LERLHPLTVLSLMLKPLVALNGVDPANGKLLYLQKLNIGCVFNTTINPIGLMTIHWL